MVVEEKLQEAGARLVVIQAQLAGMSGNDTRSSSMNASTVARTELQALQDQ